VTGHVDGKEPISGSKLGKGDGNFTIDKEMVGFIFDGIKRTVRLPLTKAAAYIKEIYLILRRTSVPRSTKSAPNVGGKAPSCIHHTPGGAVSSP